MRLQGTVRGGIYPVVQQSYDEPIDGAKICKQCGSNFVPRGQGNHTYCSDACRKAANLEKHRECSRRYARKMSRARRACA